jgi:enoyl-CoA hydratase/carnithine racemase
MWTSHTLQAESHTAGPDLQELIFTARRVGGSEARQLGLVDHCVDAGGAMDRALELARDISQVSARACGVWWCTPRCMCGRGDG